MRHSGASGAAPGGGLKPGVVDPNLWYVPGLFNVEIITLNSTLLSSKIVYA